MIDHVTIGVTDLDRLRVFYDPALKPLGIERLCAEGQPFAGCADPKEGGLASAVRERVATGAHIAFADLDRATVDACHVPALAAGGRDNGSPGLRLQYRANHYGAFVLDSDGPQYKGRVPPVRLTE